MRDLIERQAEIDTWRADFKGYVDCLDLPMDDYNGIMEYIDEAPSVQPERKTGRWVIRETAYESIEAKCSCCGFETLVDEPGNGLHMVDDLHYCPNCGARMEGNNETD